MNVERLESRQFGFCRPVWNRSLLAAGVAVIMACTSASAWAEEEAPQSKKDCFAKVKPNEKIYNLYSEGENPVKIDLDEAGIKPKTGECLPEWKGYITGEFYYIPLDIDRNKGNRWYCEVENFKKEGKNKCTGPEGDLAYTDKDGKSKITNTKDSLSFYNFPDSDYGPTKWFGGEGLEWQ